MKTIAMYLPQFYQIPLNDNRFFPGFTEWEAVKRATPCFAEHNQPRVPLNNRYYNLMEPETLCWQQYIAHKYGIDGFCFYHYYFKDGLRVMEKPVEILLHNKTIQLDYCFCWANESWGLSDGNIWANRYLSVQEITVEQEYGGKDQWSEHYRTIRDHFLDKRYLKRNGKPLFLIYRPDLIPDFSAFSSHWNTLAQADGFSGICFIGLNMKRPIPGFDAELLHAPNCGYPGGNTNLEHRNGVLVKSYDRVWENILRCESHATEKTYYGGFVDFDNTPRYSNDHAMCMEGANPERFAYHFEKLVWKNQLCGNDIIWINAWNEWGEGNYLEPDTKNVFRYLESIRSTYLRLGVL